MNRHVKSDVESLKKDIEKFRNELGTMLTNLGSYSEEQIQEKSNRLRKAVAEFQGMASKRLHNANETIHQQSDRALQSSRQMVTSKPLTTVIVSFAAGLVTAIFMERNRHE